MGTPRWLPPLLVVVVTFLAYSGTVHFDFVFDDQGQIVLNLFLRSWRYLPRYFSSHVWSHLFPYGPANYYRPLFLVWLRLNYALFGLKPMGWHLTTVAAHLAVTIEVYWLAIRLLKDRAAAVFGSLVFGLHPAHVEAVAWVSGVDEPLLALLFLGSFHSYLIAREGGVRTWKWRLTSWLLYAAAILVKETAVIFPIVVFTYDQVARLDPQVDRGWADRGRGFRASVTGALPFLLITAAYLPIRIEALGRIGHVLTLLPFSTLVCTWPSLLWFYIKLLVWPQGLSPFYDTPYVTRQDVRGFLLPLLGILAVVALLWLWAHLRRKRAEEEKKVIESRAVIFSSAWLALPVLPLLNLSVFDLREFAHDRYLYLPSVGFAWLAASGWRHIKAGCAEWLGQPALRVAIGAVVACLLGVLTALQSTYWSDDLVLFTRGTQMAPHNPNAKLDLARVAFDRGYYQAAIRIYNEILQEDPHYWLAIYNLGYSSLVLGKLAEADSYLRRAIAANPQYPDAYFYLGLTRFEEGQPEQAAELIGRALAFRPEGAGYHFALGIVQEKSGRLRAALDEFRTELGYDPDMVQARDHIAEIEARLNSSPKNADVVPPAQPVYPPREK